MKKNLKILNEDLADIAAALEALIGTVIMVGLAAVIFRIALGKW